MRAALSRSGAGSMRANEHAPPENASLSTIGVSYACSGVQCACSGASCANNAGSNPLGGLSSGESLVPDPGETHDGLGIHRLHGQGTAHDIRPRARGRRMRSGTSPSPCTGPSSQAFSALGTVRQVPFGTASIPADGAGLATARTRLLVQGSPECFTVIVDMLCKRLRTTMLMLAGSRARILLSMRDGAGKLADCPRAGLTSAHPACDG
jgi:hypothetical protein